MTETEMAKLRKQKQEALLAAFKKVLKSEGVKIRSYKSDMNTTDYVKNIIELEITFKGQIVLEDEKQ